jgi:hypothetical protein
MSKRISKLDQDSFLNPEEKINVKTNFMPELQHLLQNPKESLNILLNL